MKAERRLFKIGKALDGFRQQVHDLHVDPAWWRLRHFLEAAEQFCETLALHTEQPGDQESEVEA